MDTAHFMTAKENLLRTIFRDSPEWIPYGLESVIEIRPPIVERPRAAGKDAFGVMWDFRPQAEGGTYPAHGGNVIDSIDEWREKLVLPDVDAADWSGAEKRAAEIDREQHLVSGFVEMGLFERSYLLLGMEEALVSYITEPEEMRAMLHVLADYKIRFIERYYEAIKPDMIWYGDDWGTQTNLFIPVDVWRCVIRPETQRIYDCMKRLGIMVNQHSCGKIDSVVGDIVEMGAVMWNPCQPCNDLAGLKKKYGDRLCFIGGIDSQFVLNRPGVTLEEVDAEVKKRIDEMGRGGGYVAQPSHSVPYDRDVLDAMANAIRKYGKRIG